jgi:hypothetical protein
MKQTDPKQLLLNWEAACRESQPRQKETPSAAPTQAEEPAGPKKPRRRRSDIVARLPVPRPLPGSVAAGHFGHDDDGKVICPQADEIRAITESLADRLVELQDAMSEVKQENARQAMQEQYTQAIQMYALEFGERPARQLEAYVRRQASLDDDDRTQSGWQR